MLYRNAPNNKSPFFAKKSADWKHGLFLFSCKWLLPCGSYSTMTGGTVEIPVGWISIINTYPPQNRFTSCSYRYIDLNNYLAITKLLSFDQVNMTAEAVAADLSLSVSRSN